MPILIKCEGCGKQLQVEDHLAGKEGKCPACGAALHIPAGQPAPAAPEAGAEKMTDEDLAAVERLTAAYKLLRAEMAKAIVGQEQVLEELMMCVFARGHAILEGVPGLAKTLMVSSLARCLNLEFARIQFTPDLMPSDITGTEVIQEDRATGTRDFKFLEGPIFNNIILADEINRTPPKTQAALLQAMQEYHVTAGGERHDLEPPFFVLATQNPIEQEGTYPLPEAQLDRFMFMVLVDYPTLKQERLIVKTTTMDIAGEPEAVLSAEDILSLQKVVRKVPVSQHVIDYAVNLARASRPADATAPDFVNTYLTWGAGPRAAQYLILGAKSRALLHGRYNVSCEDVRAVAKPVMRHRIFTNFNADAESITPDDLIEMLIKAVAEPTVKDYAGAE